MIQSVKKSRNYWQFGGILVGIILIFLMLRNSDISQLWMHVSSVGSSFFLVIGATFAAQVLAVLAWYLSFLNFPPLLMIPELYAVRLIGESFSQVNPTSIVAGETLKLFLLKRLLGVRYKDGAMSIVLSRVMIGLNTGFLLLIGVVFLFQSMSFGNFKIFSLVLSAGVVLLFVYFFHALSSGHGIFYIFAVAAKRVGGRFAIVQKVVTYFLDVDQDLVKFYKRRPVSFYSVFILSVLHQVMGAVEFYVIFRALGIDVSFFSCIIFDIASMLFRTAGFFIPGQLGMEELGNKVMFSIIDIPGDDTWLTVSLIRRARQLLWISFGFLFYIVVSRIAHLRYKDVSTGEE